jgi:archaeal flagellar protein FlaJ
MSVRLETPYLIEKSEPLLEYATHIEPLMPQLEWNLKRSGYVIESHQYIAIVLYLTAVTLTMLTIILVVPVALAQGMVKSYPSIVLTICITTVTAMYLFIQPNLEIRRRARLIDRDLEYMLKDMRIQLSAGVPLFDTLVNIVRGGYGECSNICEGIIQEVEQGRSITEVLDNVGMWSPSEYLRRMLWQIVNALKSGSDVSEALEIIANDIRLDKENRIKSYGKELNLYGLVYLMFAIIGPSMGVTLLAILSGFLGKDAINETLFWLVLFGVIIGQVFFISYVRGKRPQV